MPGKCGAWTVAGPGEVAKSMPATFNRNYKGRLVRHLRRSVVLALTLLGLLGVQLVAQQSPKQVVVRAGRVVDVKTGKLLPDQTTVIADGKNVSMRATAET